jgi:hypothetical protein
MSQTIPRNPTIPNGPGDLRNRFPSQPNPYNIPATPAPPVRPYVPQAGGSPPALNPFANRNGVAIPGVPKTPGGNYVGPRQFQPFTQNLSRVQQYASPSARRWINPALQPGFGGANTVRGFNWSINTRSLPKLPAIPRSPGLNPRWPRWARIPPRMRIPSLIGVGGAGLAILRPSPIDLLFGIIPDAMEAARPWVWEQLGIKDPNAAASTDLLTQLVRGQRYQLKFEWQVWVKWQDGRDVPTTNASTLNGSRLVIIEAPFTGVELKRTMTSAQEYAESWDARSAMGLSNIENKTGNVTWPSYVYLKDLRITQVQHVATGQPVATGVVSTPPGAAAGSSTANPTNGIQPGTTPYSGMPAASPGGRPATDPRGWRPDLANPPQTSLPPRTAVPPEPKQPDQATNCRFDPADQSEIDGLKETIRDRDETIRRLQEQLQAANQVTFYEVPYVVEDSAGDRKRRYYPLLLKGLVDPVAETSLSNQTADWAMAKADKSEKIYQILGGDQTWGNQPTPRAEINPDVQLRAQPVINEQGLGEVLQVRNLPQLFTATQAVTYQRQGLQQFPLTVEAPKLTDAGLLPDRTAAQVFNTATDVQMTTSTRGWAIVKGVNEVITKTKQTIEWLKIDRILNLLNLATTLHNALMLSNALGQTLLGIIDNVLATFGFALKDATGDTIGVGDLIGGTIENVIKAVVGADNYTNLKKEWAKANRIYQAGMNVIYSVQSIGYSILGALEVVGKWVAWIGNALKRFGALTEKAYPWMNPSPNFQNPIFTKIEAAQEMAEALEVVSSETRSVTETVSELGNQKKALEDSLKDGKDKPGVSNVEQQQNQDKLREASQAPIIPKFDLVRPEPEDR